jgi:hypothetical protein
MADLQTKNGAWTYFVAGLGFIPAFGVPFAIATIILGLVRFKQGGKKLILLGCLGTALTVGLYGTLFYKGFMERGGEFDELRRSGATLMLTELVRRIEYYRNAKGQYPGTLLELEDFLGNTSSVTVYDLMTQQALSSREKTLFFFQLTDNKSHYYLLGIGTDGKPFTADDVLPDLPEQERTKTGLLLIK